ncbi:thiamine phosphate synthase [Leptolyngbya sp. FACHB-261]|uniref:thiamine phosphate synthase n=1 Tax=Leptolyngbya sp. FACHB-261 TaxID=2692806 RepID=UPI0016896336|nr:thiamine phosphate synthase [Leptolyngbya sp. FACHB-261]MBD2105309.1 thiamine phosphate synthase [Leptolyngbya sp. FACHB-261]
MPSAPAQLHHQAIKRILDANLDRAREGLRVVEEWCRFGLENAQLSQECKQLRAELAPWHTADLLAARDTAQDPGTGLSHAAEEERNSLEAVLRANLCRVQEAFRVLEEYGKLWQPRMGSHFKHLRYRVYILESALLGSNPVTNERLERLKAARLYLVTSPVDNPLAVVEAALQGGLPLVQYRHKTADDEVRLPLAQHLAQLCRQYGALFIVNDRVDLALAVDADGVHLGQQDMPVAIARQLLGPNRIIGQSTTNPSEMAKAIESGADYIGVGPIYETPTKVGKAATGLDYARYAAAKAPLPWYAIGGIDATNLPDVLAAGAERVAVVRAIMSAANPTEATRALLAQLTLNASPVPCPPTAPT